jgi:nicotinate phosphoribosyltransferase
MSTALLTDRYELTMIDAAIRSGRHDRECIFEVLARRLPDGRRYGIVGGTGRLLDLISEFRFGDAELEFLRNNNVVAPATLDWLADYSFHGNVTGYREGEAYFPGSPLLVIDGTFAEAVILETLVLSVLNYDSAIASAAARMVSAAGGRPLAEMGSRRTGERSAVAAARAAFIAGFGATSNLEAGRRWGIPTMGTAAHSFTLLHDSEEEAFRAQVDALGPETTLLVDTYDVTAAVDLAVKVAGTGLGAVRIDSGDLPAQVAAVRAQLDSLGATGTKITVTNDLDEYTIAALGAAPVNSFGVGTSVVTGSGHPAAGMVYKLVARRDDSGEWVSVAKKSVAKATVGGRKSASRALVRGVATEETIHVETDARAPFSGGDAFGASGAASGASGAASGASGAAARGATALGAEGGGKRPLMVALMTGGVADQAWTGAAGTLAAREHCAAAVAELPADALRLSRGEPAIPTRYR